MTRAREAGSGRRARGEALKQGEGIGHDRTSRVWAGGGQRGREVRIIPPIIVCSRSGS